MFRHMPSFNPGAAPGVNGHRSPSRTACGTGPDGSHCMPGRASHHLMPAISSVTFHDRTYFARHPVVPGAPHTSLTQLIQGIWETKPEQARAILRKRIHTTEELTPLAWGMVKTAAQRVSQVSALAIGADWHPVSFTSRYEAPPLTRDQAQLAPMALARDLAQLVHREDVLHRSDRSVACVLAGRSGEILAWANNTNRDNRTLHAEVNLLQSWWEHARSPIPADATLYTTLEPCRMCLGMIHQVAPDLPVLHDRSDAVPPVPWPTSCAPFEPRE